MQMNRTARLGFVVLLLLSVPAIAVSAEFSVGAAVGIVTPPAGSYLAGYGRDRRAESRHDDLYARAVVIQAQHEAVAIVVIDCIGLLYPDVQRIRARAVALLDGEVLAPERIIVTSTHTHAGPDVAGLWGGHIFSSGRDEAYIDHLVETAAQQIVQAVAALQPALMKAGSATAVFSWVENRSEPGLLDNRISVVQFVDDAGNSIATLTNYPCHPTVLGPDNHQISADYVGGFYQFMDSSLGGVNLFLQGAIGGWVQPLQGDRSFALAREYGELLGEVSSAVLLEAERIAQPAISFASTTFDIPLRNFGFRLLMFIGVLDRQMFDGGLRTEVAWFSVGGVQIATHPGETSPAYSIATRNLMGNPRHSMVLGLGLDALGYILKPEFFTDPESYPHADYLTTVSVGPAAAPRLMQALQTIVPQTQPGQSGTGAGR